MKALIALVLGAFFISLNPVCAQTEGQKQEWSEHIVEAVRSKNFTWIISKSDSLLSTKISDSLMVQTFTGLEGMYGKNTGFEKGAWKNSGKIQIYTVAIVYENGILDLSVSWDSTEKISGFFLKPKVQKWSRPDYADSVEVIEEEVFVGKDPWSLPATFSFPAGKSSFPAVVLVHGSGPNDRDESIGGVKVFKDIAYGLAAQGIAVLRYEKRTKFYAKELSDSASVTLNQEVIEDAVAALNWVAARKEVNTVVLAGHSLGAMMAPSICELYKPDGVVLMAGSPRFLGDIVIEQFRYLADAYPDNKQYASALEEAEPLYAHLISQKFTANTPLDSCLLGIPAPYWMEVKKLTLCESLRKLKSPVLVVKGERDYQVTLKDFEAYQTCTSGLKNFEYKLLPGLNHCFVFGKGASIPSEYTKQDHVSASFIQELSGFVNKVNPKRNK